MRAGAVARSEAAPPHAEGLNRIAEHRDRERDHHGEAEQRAPDDVQQAVAWRIGRAQVEDWRRDIGHRRGPLMSGARLCDAGANRQQAPKTDQADAGGGLRQRDESDGATEERHGDKDSSHDGSLLDIARQFEPAERRRPEGLCQ